MNTLLYLVSIDWGDEENSDVFEAMTNVCIRTIRNAGQYDGDIILITDKPYLYDDNNLIDYTVTPVKECQTYGDVMLHKFMMSQLINENNYDSILYLDTDIVAINDINPLFKLPNDNILFAEEFPINFITNIDFLTEEEREEAKGIPRINAGTFVCDGNVYHDYMERMEYTVRDHIKQGLDPADQLPITAMILRDKLEYDNIPHGWVEFPLAAKTVGPPPVITKDTKLLHFIGHKYDPEERFKHMKHCYTLATDEQYGELNSEYSP